MTDVKFLTTFYDTENFNYNFVPKFFKNLFEQARAPVINTNSEYQISFGEA